VSRRRRGCGRWHARRPRGGPCVAVPDDRAAFDGEIARLPGEPAALKKAMLDRGLPLPNGVAAVPPAARNDREPSRDLNQPSNADIDRMIAAVEKVWRRPGKMVVGPRQRPEEE